MPDETARCVSVEELIYLLRAQRHDFLNHLQVILGYLQLGKTNTAIDYVKTVSQEITEAGRLMQMPWPELATVLLLKSRQAEENETNVEVHLGKNLERIGDNPEELVGIIGDIYDLICYQLGDCRAEERQVIVDVDEEDGAYVIKFSWPQGSNRPFDKFGLLAHPVMETARQNFRRVELSDQEGKVWLSLYLPDGSASR